MENHSWARHERDVRLHRTELQLAVVRSRKANIQEILLEEPLVLMILIPPRLLRRLDDKEKEGLELHFGFQFLTLPTIIFLIWPLKAFPYRDESL